MANSMFGAGSDFDLRGACVALNDGARAAGVYSVSVTATDWPAEVTQDVYSIARLQCETWVDPQGLRVQFETFYHASQLTALTGVLTRWNYYFSGSWHYGAWSSETGVYEGPSLQSGWRTDAGYGCFGKIRKFYNTVSVEFAPIKADSAPGTTDICTLPVGYRPLVDRKFPCVALDAGFYVAGYIAVDSGGGVGLWYTPGAGVTVYANFSFSTV